MKLRDIKLELFYIRKAFLEKGQGFRYLWNKYVQGKSILRSNKVLEKSVNNHDLSIHTLTQHKDVLQTIWSLGSFYNNSENRGQLYIHDDGSLDENDINIFKKYFPSSKIVNTNDFFESYADELTRYPLLMKFRGTKKYYMLKKLVDQYFVSDKKYRLFIDSDLIWLKNPREIEQEIENGCQNSLMTRGEKPHPELTVHYKENGKLSEDLAIFNSGIVLYKKENFNLEKLEDYLALVDTDNNLNDHFIEQAGFACCLERLKSLPYERYTIKNKLSDQVVVKHYTGPRRFMFWVEGVDVLNL